MQYMKIQAINHVPLIIMPKPANYCHISYCWEFIFILLPNCTTCPDKFLYYLSACAGHV